MTSHSSSIFSDDQSESASETAAERHFDPDWAADQVPGRHADGRTLRKSCDRCHQQKLRCVGDKTSLTQCMRCRRAGVDCVYSVRSSKQPNKNGLTAEDPGHVEPVNPTSNPLSELETVFDPDLEQLDDIFASLPSSWAAVGATASLASYAVPPSQSTGIAESSLSTGGPSSSNSIAPEASVGSPDVPSDLSGRLTHVCQALETTFQKVTRDRTDRTTQDCIIIIPRLSAVEKVETANSLQLDPIGEVFGVFDAFLKVLALDEMVAISTSRTPQTLFDEYLRSKQASMAAQCYIVCIKLMVSLSEQMLQSLLASPLPTPRPAFGHRNVSEASQNTNAPVAREGVFSDASRIPENLKLGDLYVPLTDPFGHALNSTIDIFQIGSRLLGRMEQLLGIPIELGGGNMSSVLSSEQVGLDQHPRPSLPARFVASIWEDEAHINQKSAVTYFRRCRAAILGLTMQHV